MNAIVQPSALSGIVVAPASKSAMQRACAAALIRGGKTILKNAGVSADDQAALSIIEQLGASIEKSGDSLSIDSAGIHVKGERINCGESGLSVRMFTSIAAVSPESLDVTGSGSLVKRPLTFFDEVLPHLGVHCTSNKGYLPLQIKGPLQPSDIEVDGSLSSQYLTGLLFAYSAAGAKDVTISVNNLNSKPYIDLTLHVMTEFGLPTPENVDYKKFIFNKEPNHLTKDQPFNFTIESDWSGAAFLLVAGAVAGDIVVKGLDVFSTQADKNILQPLMQSEAIMSIREEEISVKKNTLRPFHFNATDCPDLFPPLAALAAHCKGTSVIEGVHRLTHKESNRAETLKDVFGKMGVDIQLQDDMMVIRGGGTIMGTQVSSHHDHRIAMACAVAGLTCTGSMDISHAEAVNKSYPQFWDHLKKLRAEVSLKTIE